MATEGSKLAAALYTEHKRSLQTFVRKRVPRADALHTEDVVQETFVRAVKQLNNGKAVRSPKGFLYTTARNLITSMFYRRRDFRQTDATADMDEYAAAANVCSPERRVMVQQQLDALSAAIAGLPKNYQEAFVRRRVWGESCREIGEKMGLKEHTVGTYVALGWNLLEQYCKVKDIPLNIFTDYE